jgi:hypothetical protein
MKKKLLITIVVVLASVSVAVMLRSNRPHPHIVQHTTCLAMGMKAGWALDEYRKTHPGYPPALAELVPGELSGAPYCPATKEPLHYESNGTSYVLYCPAARDAAERGAMETYPVHRPVDNVNKVENQSGPPPTL